MSNLVLSSQNAVDNATLYGDQDTGFELTKLQDSNFSKIWRFTPAANVDGSTARFALSLGLITRCSHADFARHNWSQGAQLRVRAGTARLDVDFTDDAELTSPWVTFGGGTNGTYTNEYGVMVTGGAPRYEHDRRCYSNGFKYSEDLTQADWLVALAKKYSDGVTVNFEVGAADPTERVTNGSFNSGLTGWNVLDNFGTADASSGQLVLTDGSGRVTYSQQITVTPGKRYFVSAKIGGTGTGTLRVNKTNNFAAIDTVNLASNQGLTLTGSFTATQANMWVCLGPSSGLSGQTGTFDDITITEIGSQLYQVPGYMYADTYEVRAQVRLVSGDPTFKLKVSDDSASPSFSSTFTATTKWQWFSASLSCASTTGSGSLGHGGIYKTGGGGVLQIRRLQIRRGASNGKYRKTTSQRRYQRVGLLRDISNTNVLLQSSGLNTASWAKSGATVTPNTAVAPDGTVTMATVTASAAGQTVTQSTSLGGTTTRAASFFFQTNGSTCTQAILVIYWSSGGVTQSVQVSVNAATGAFNSSAGSGATLTAAGVQDLGSGFYRAYVVGAGTDAANTVVQTQLFLNAAGTVVVWGFQNEATFVTSYIPTTTAAVTRSQDTAQVTGSWFTSIYNHDEGTLYAETAIPQISAPKSSGYMGGVIFYKSGGGIWESAGLRILLSSSGAYVTDGYVIANSGNFQADFSDTIVNADASFKQALRYRANDFAYCINGGAVQTDTAGLVPGVNATPDTLDLMVGLWPPAGGGVGMTTYLKRVTFWQTGKSDADLQALSASGPGAVEYDSGWLDALQMPMTGDVPTNWGYDYDVIRTFTDRAVEWMRVGIYDPAKTDGASPIECGRLFMGKLTLQPAINASFGLTDGWDDSATTFVETQNRRKVFNQLPKLREAIFDLTYLTPDEGAILHEMDGSGGLSGEVMYIPDPDDLAACQRFGFLGLMEKLDVLKYPLFNTRGKSFQIRKKR